MAPSSDAVAIVAIVAGAAVGIGAPLVTATAQRHQAARQFEFQRGETDTQELRAILDQISEDLYGGNSVAVALAEVASLYDHAGWRAGVEQACGQLGTRESAVLSQLQRLALRLGPEANPMRDPALQAANAMRSLARLLFDADSWNDAADEFDRLHDQLQDGRIAFVDAALRFTKVRLPGLDVL